MKATLMGSPTLLKGWLGNEIEAKVVWERLDLRPNEIKVVPLLMCPDDCDFSCTIVVAEMRLSGDKVFWNKIGIDNTDTRSDRPKTIGRNIDWIKDIGPYQFDKMEFLKCVEMFRMENG